MSREWKPGDVAMGHREFVAFTDDYEWIWAATGLACPNGGSSSTRTSRRARALRGGAR